LLAKLVAIPMPPSLATLPDVSPKSKKLFNTLDAGPSTLEDWRLLKFPHISALFPRKWSPLAAEVSLKRGEGLEGKDGSVGYVKLIFASHRL
jgi:hypothetical protein